MDLDVYTLESIGYWIKVHRYSTMNMIQSTWAFKIKQYPNVLINSFKPRVFVHGDIQIEIVDFQETYVPVVNWITVQNY